MWLPHLRQLRPGCSPICSRHGRHNLLSLRKRRSATTAAAGMTVRMPSPRDLSDGDWTIVLSPSVELALLTLLPERACAAAAAFSLLTFPPSPPSALGGAPSNLPFCTVFLGEFNIDFDFDRT
ncbi:hypothetical protein GALMADRAFT_1140734 [Galerina marginata CBS 339.88]|uniref:Uncharacterized protein n=1 Tax=Galerina marginata (strain CBS 339.88) TaxID=685588 RepID=A0A067S7J4_GALM3|nr:hypothetical protein GALMADRAFT_1140734 [Galerina marginata CBS 339.88]